MQDTLPIVSPVDFIVPLVIIVIALGLAWLDARDRDRPPTYWIPPPPPMPPEITPSSELPTLPPDGRR